MRYGVLMLFLSLLFCSCNVERQIEKIEFHGVDHVELRGSTLKQTGFDVYANMVNSSGKTFGISEAKIEVFVQETKIVTITFREAVKLPKHYEGTVKIPIKVEYEGALGALGVVPVLMTRINSATVNIDAKARAGALRKNIKLNNVPIRALSEDLGLDIEDMIKNL